MKILYVHGFGSGFDPENPKVKTMGYLGEIVGVDVDYCEGFESAYQEVSDAANGCDLIVGTSMGGYMASHVGASQGIPFVALNPAVMPSKTLVRHIGDFVDYTGKESKLSAETVSSYPDIRMTDGCGLVLLESGDDVIDPEVTRAMLSEIYLVKQYAGGSHRFESLEDRIGEIEEFICRSEVVYGY
jgi:uncharacterized protein